MNEHPATGRHDRFLWVGSYTPTMGGAGAGIGLLRVRAADDALEFLGTVAETSSPSFVSPSVDGRVLYSADEAGRVEAFRRGPDHTLKALGGQPTSGGFPCHLSVTSDHLYACNYGDGSIDVFPLDHEGRIGPARQRLASRGSGPNPAQDGPHAHSTLVIGDTVLSADLGTDRVHAHSADGGTLARTASAILPPGTGPRDLRVHGDRVILLGELSGGVFALDGTGAVVASGRLVESWVDGDHAAGLAVDSTGTFLYSGLRGSNRIAVVRLSDLSAVADVPCEGDWPRHLCILPGADEDDLLLVANQLSSSIAGFRIDRATGIPRPSGSPVRVASPTFLQPVL